MTFLMVVVLGSIFAGWATATESAGVGVLGSIVIGGSTPADAEMATTPSARGARTDGVPHVPRRDWVFLRVPGAGRRRCDVVALGEFGIDTKWEMLAFIMVLIFLLGFPFEWRDLPDRPVGIRAHPHETRFHRSSLLPQPSWRGSERWSR